jgi:hypothetical protein
MRTSGSVDSAVLRGVPVPCDVPGEPPRRGRFARQGGGTAPGAVNPGRTALSRADRARTGAVHDIPSWQRHTNRHGRRGNNRPASPVRAASRHDHRPPTALPGPARSMQLACTRRLPDSPSRRATRARSQRRAASRPAAVTARDARSVRLAQNSAAGSSVTLGSLPAIGCRRLAPGAAPRNGTAPRPASAN